MELTVHQHLPYPLDRVWSALTDPAELTAWFWPQRLQPVADLDLRSSGPWRIAGVGMAVGGTYTDVVPTHRLAFTWQWDGDDLITTVTITLTPDTDLTLVHAGFRDEAARDDHVTGWSDCLARLSDRLAELSGAPQSPR